MPDWQMELVSNIADRLLREPQTASNLARLLIKCGDTRCFSTVYTQVRHVLHTLYGLGLIKCEWNSAEKLWSVKQTHVQIARLITAAVHHNRATGEAHAQA